MFRPAVRSLLCRSSTRPTIILRPESLSRRNLFTATSPKKSRFKGTVLRWALAGGIVYWYATSNVFANQPKFLEERPDDPSPEDTDRPPSLLHEKPRHGSPPDAEPRTLDKGTHAEPTTPEELEEEAGQEGAFNPETGEINWDCPCLGGMAHGPCGEDFKAAFSCFVFSTEEPKGVDCIEKFKAMQSCFQKHPEVYGSELDDDDEEEEDREDGESSITDEDAPSDTSVEPKPANTPRGDPPAAPTGRGPKTNTQTLPQAAGKTHPKSSDHERPETPNEAESRNGP